MSRRRRQATRENRDELRAARREELLDAAVEVIRREGPAASMEAIAAEAGITKPILYRHFEHRVGLVDAVGMRFSSQLSAKVAAALSRPGDPQEVLATTIDAYVAFIDADPHVYRFLIDQALKHDPDKLQGFIRQVAADVSIVLGERMRDAGLDSGAAEPWAFGIVGMVHLAGDWWAERRTMPRERLVDYLVTLLWSGLAGAGLAGSSDQEPTRPVPLHRKEA